VVNIVLDLQGTWNERFSKKLLFMGRRADVRGWQS
jgi:hypothetical protein